MSEHSPYGPSKRNYGWRPGAAFVVIMLAVLVVSIHTCYKTLRGVIYG